MFGIRSGIFTSVATILLAPAVLAQGVAFQPVVGAIPNGPALGVTPAVSIDRRYVRLGVNPQFIGNVGFNTFLVPAAVGGGPGGPAALGGLGLGVGGGGGGGGGQFLAGMDGVIAPGMGSGLGGVPQGYGFMGNPATASYAQPGYGGMVGGPRWNTTGPPRVGASKALRRGRTTRKKAKPAASITEKKGGGRR